MIEVTNIIMRPINDPGCNNGNYPEYVMGLSNGEILNVITCRCGNGCSNTDRLPKIGMVFANEQELNDFLKGVE